MTRKKNDSAPENGAARGRSKARGAAAGRLADAPPKNTKSDTIITLLSRPAGATIEQMIDATRWQAHSVRGFMAGTLKKRGLGVTSDKADGVRIYRLANPAK